MATGQLAPLLHYLRTVAAPGTCREISDGELLSRFIRLHEESAFTMLVRRHGPMVFAVCRRVLRDTHTAEDAFQATFLVLARKAPSLAQPELLGHWLHGVAYRTAIKAKTEASRRRKHEQHVALATEIVPNEDFVWREVRAVLDDEVHRLPTRYRVPVVLCYLQGQTNAEAARRLGCSRGTVATLLARAREKLRRRLTQRGLGLSAGLALAGLVETAQGGAVPRMLEQVTVKAASLLAAGQTSALGALAASAVALAKGVSKGMLMEKLKLPAAMVMISAMLGAGVGVTTFRARVQANETAKAEAEAKPQIEKAEQERPSARVVTEREDEQWSFRSANFLVTAPTPEIAERVARAAEDNRKTLAKLWLGKEMPTWDQPCPLRVTLSRNGAGGATTFAFDNGRVRSMDMHLEGTLDQLLADALPHEITHTVLAWYFRKPLPRWADEGAAILSESAASREKHERALEKYLRASDVLPLRRLLPGHDYPKETMRFYAQSVSLTEFLISKGGRKTFLTFVAEGEDRNWDEAARSVYGYETVEELEQAWLAYARKRIDEKRGDEAPRPPQKSQVGPIKMEATSKGVLVEIGAVQARAQRVRYDEANGQLQLEGSDEMPAILSRKPRPGQKEQTIRAKWINYSLKDGVCEVRSLLIDP